MVTATARLEFFGSPYIDVGVFATQEWRRIGVEAEHRPLESAAWFADGRDTENAYYIPGLWWARTVAHWAKVKKD